MSSVLLSQFRRFFSFEGVSPKAIIVTALISYVLQINSIVSGQPLYIIALVTLLPWLPILLFEGIWKVKNYSVIAALGLFTILQMGHFAEHVIQVVQLQVMNGTVACPPPVDNADNARRAVELGLRSESLPPSFYSAEKVAKPGPDGKAIKDANGQMVIGPAACAVFGQLDIEVVHLVWELIGYLGTAIVLLFFPRNRWLFVALLCLAWHALEHLTISYFYYFDQAPAWAGVKTLWATVPIQGNSYLAVPAGQVSTLVSFYDAGGKFGLLAKNGLFELLTGFKGMPPRPILHMLYNLAITVPTVIGFAIELKKLRSRYLEMMFSDLSKDQLADLSLKVKDAHFGAGQTILKQGDAPVHCYLIKEGTVAIYLEEAGQPGKLIAEVGPGQLIGEMGLLDQKPRSATVVALTRCECLEIGPDLFKELVSGDSGTFRSEKTMQKIQSIARARQAMNAALPSAA